MNELNDYKISQVADTLMDGQYLFALDSKQNLIAIDINLPKGVNPY